MTKNNFEQLGDLNAEFFESAKLSLLDPLGLYLANDVKWIKLNQNWNSLKFPVVIGGKGQPILFYMALIVVFRIQENINH